MADNVTLNPPSVVGGAVVATDDIGGVQFPVSKIALGASGVADGFVGVGNPLPAETQQQPLTWAASNGAPITTAANTPVIAAPSAGFHLVPVSLQVCNMGATPVRVAFRQGVAGALRHDVPLPQYVPARIMLGRSWALPTATALYLYTSAAGEVHWTIGYVTEAD